MQLRWVSWILLCAWVLGSACACTAYKVKPPEHRSVSLSRPSRSSAADFLVETQDLIGDDRSLGAIGEFWFGGQYNVVLDESLVDYLEAEVVRELQNSGKQCFSYPGEFTMQRMRWENPPPLHLRLELQEIAMSKHPMSHWLADNVLGVCKIRCVLHDGEGNLVYQRQFVGNVDTHRPTDDLVIPGIGLLSRRGLSLMLSELLKSTVRDFRDQGVPEMIVALDEYRGTAKQPEDENLHRGWSESEPEDESEPTSAHRPQTTRQETEPARRDPEPQEPAEEEDTWSDDDLDSF